MESSTQLFYQAATLMLVGMGFVYAFLSLLIFVIKVVIAPLAERYPDKIAAAPRVRNTIPNATIGDSTNAPLVAVISAAISQYRNKDNKSR